MPVEEVLYKERIYPGRMFMLDTARGEIVQDSELKAALSSRRPYGQWLEDNMVQLEDLPEPDSVHDTDFETLESRQAAFGYTLEDLRIILEPMALTGADPVGSMGTDVPLAVMSEQSPVLFHYFRQRFAQVSNPPLDSIREGVDYLDPRHDRTRVEPVRRVPRHCRQLTVKEPFITNSDLEKIREIDVNGIRSRTLSMLFDPEERGGLKNAMDRLRREASQAIDEGYSILILSDRGVDADHAPIPSLLATAGVHHHLIREGTRTRCGLVVESGEPRDIAHLALLVGYGAGAVNPYMVFESMESMIREDYFLTNIDYKTAEYNFIKAAHKGVVKIMAKMGISTIQSYRGAQIFEAIGLNEDFIDEYFGLDTLPHRRDWHRRDRRRVEGKALLRLRESRDARKYAARRRRLLPVEARRRVPHVEPHHYREAPVRRQVQQLGDIPGVRGLGQRLLAADVHHSRPARLQARG